MRVVCCVEGSVLELSTGEVVVDSLTFSGE
jgi:hypothetical protein